MIKKIFLPEIYKNRRVYSQTILGFSIEDSYITCAKVIAGKTQNIVKKVIKEKLRIESDKDHNYKVKLAINNIISGMGRYDKVYVSIPASKVVFKELEVPFLEMDKIRMILDYEIESKLPFSIKDSVLDFIITKQIKEEKKSQIIVAAVRNQDIENILNLYEKAGVNPSKITIDLFSIYSIFRQIPEYRNIKNSSTIIDLGSSSTRIALLQDGNLKLTRVIPKGINTIAKNISNQINKSIEEVKKNIKNFGLMPTGNKEYDDALQKNAIAFFNDIQFTLNSFTLKLALDKAISKILFTGHYSKIKNLTSFCKNLLQIPCEIFDCEKIFSNSNFINKTKSEIEDWNQFTIALGTAILSPETLNFNLRRKSFEPKQINLLSKQLITSILLTSLIFITLIVYGYFQINSLSKKIKTIEKEETRKLLKIFPKDFKLPKKINFKSLINRADRLISEKLEMWGPFEKQELKPLLILQELTNIIDKRRFDVTMESVAITEEDEKAKIEIEGFFRSKTGSDHFTYFADLAKRFEDSKILEFWDPREEIESRPVEDKGIIFSATLKLKE
ncbi:hypothetical protein GF385_03015 [Candidatus Dependentiae bacterium]|nr:hypothetical protein [Candidatus Dependentiae bacterium]